MSKTLLRFFVAVAVGGGVLIPHFAWAQLDQKCWTKTACTAARKRIIADTQDTLTQEQIDQGLQQDGITEKACDGLVWGKEPVGFCLPAGKATTKISFGGESKFSDIGQFIKSMYRYTIWAAAILAAAMLIVAGFQWAASGGSSEAIGSAKKKIAGAVAGLMLLLLSYAVLNTINPYLVNFRLPDVWLINKIGFAQFCDQLEDGDKVKLASEDPNKKLSDAEKIKNFQGAVWGNEPDKTGAECGKQYTFQSGGGQTCRGTSCGSYDKPAVCFEEFNGTAEGCFKANIGGKIINTGFPDNLAASFDSWWVNLGTNVVSNFWPWPWVPETIVSGKNVYLTAVCGDGSISEVDSSFDLNYHNTKTEENYHILTTNDKIDAAMQACENKKVGFRGFAVLMGFKLPPNYKIQGGLPEGHLLGRSVDGNAIDFGDMEFTWVTGFHDEIVSWLMPPIDYYITADQLKKGVRLNVDAANVCRINDEDSRRKKCYSKFGWNVKIYE